MTKASSFRLEWVVILLAFGIAVNSQLAAFTNKYVLNGDVFQSLFWMHQFYDNELFRNDLLTDYSKHYHAPWGFFLLYRALSVIIEPLTISKTLPVILFTVSSFYVFKLVQSFADRYTGFVAALLFMVIPIFLGSMVGGHPRAFAYLLLLAFLYYLTEHDHAKATALLIAQSLFYPMMFLVAVLTCLLSFLRISDYKILLERSGRKIGYFIVAVVMGGAILGAKYLASYHPSIGSTVTRAQMINKPEFSNTLRIPSLPKAIMGISTGPIMSMVAKYPVAVRRINKELLNTQTVPIIMAVLVLLAGSVVSLEVIRGRLAIPKEVVYLFSAAAVMYVMADLLLLKLYLPDRYLIYTIPLINVVVISLVVSHLVRQLKSTKIRLVVKAAVVVFIALHFNIHKGIGLKDYTNHYYHQNGLTPGNLPIKTDLYVHLNGLPKNAVVATHPYLADAIPTFAQRKVFVSAELSHPYFDKYWEVIKRRTGEFFESYYAADSMAIYEFCKKNGIDYLVVDKRHFDEAYLAKEKVYLEPFNQSIKHLIAKKRGYALVNIPDEDKLYMDSNVFVIDVDVLKSKRAILS